MKRKAKRANTRSSPPTAQAGKCRRSDDPSAPRWKRWGFRAMAMVGAPAIILCLIELVLRLAGYGYPVSVAVPASYQGRPAYVQNNKFGWRFFDPELARQPYPFVLSTHKPDDTIRVFVLGGSAAKGDPDPRFGLPRMIEAMLSLRHPEMHFEVVNMAMTAINSHVVLPIARDCAGLDGDVWVVYLGNNEVVGPFGAGTVFGPQTPPLPWVNATLRIKATRTGQLLDSLLRRLGPTGTQPGEWGGMEMFLNQQVRLNDPRMPRVYHHFRRNLEDIIRAGRKSGAGIVVSTVAVNLRDCAPFASVHPPEMTDQRKTQWQQLYEPGVQAQVTNGFADAADYFKQAEQLDDSFAELHYRHGQCEFALGNGPEAKRHFRLARDLDTLRFRCDSRLNDIIREVATDRESSHILLADAEKTLVEEDGLPGSGLFYEHVHLTFKGNYLLARTIVERVEQLLESRQDNFSGTTIPWPSMSDCERRLGWSDWTALVGWEGILPRLRNPPFTGQYDHDSRMKRVKAIMRVLSPASEPAGITNALNICEHAVAENPNDSALLSILSSLKQHQGDLVGAAQTAQKMLDLLPTHSEGWARLGSILAQQHRFDRANEAFHRAIQLNQFDVAARESLAQSLAAAGREEEALEEFRRVVARRPHLRLAWLHYGQVLERLSRNDEAEACFQRAVTNSSENLPGILEVAGFCQSRHQFEQAASLYAEAHRLDPANAEYCVGAGQNLAAIGRQDEALLQAEEAVRLSPDFAEARLLHGMILGRLGKVALAADEFRQALRLKPDLIDARLNLGIALANQSPAEALDCFEAVLRLNPGNPTAMKYAQTLRARLATETENADKK